MYVGLAFVMSRAYCSGFFRLLWWANVRRITVGHLNVLRLWRVWLSFFHALGVCGWQVCLCVVLSGAQRLMYSCVGSVASSVRVFGFVPFVTRNVVKLFLWKDSISSLKCGYSVGSPARLMVRVLVVGLLGICVCLCLGCLCIR